jgi:hypothetical protein
LWRCAAPSPKNTAPEWNRIGVFMRILGFVAGVLLAAFACGSALADCRDDLVKADQHFNRTRSDLQKAASATPPARCAAYRRHVASLTEVRTVFARCDTSANKEGNAAQTNTALAMFTKQMQESCKK